MISTVVLSHPGLRLTNQIDKNDPGNIIINKDSFIEQWLDRIEKRLMSYKLDAQVHVGMVDPRELEKTIAYYSEFTQIGVNFSVWCTGGNALGERFFIVDHPEYATAILVNAGTSVNNEVTLPRAIIITNPRIVRSLSDYLSKLKLELQHQGNLECEYVN